MIIDNTFLENIHVLCPDPNTLISITLLSFKITQGGVLFLQVFPMCTSQGPIGRQGRTGSPAQPVCLQIVWLYDTEAVSRTGFLLLHPNFSTSKLNNLS